jgi:uncharacterized protein
MKIERELPDGRNAFTGYGAGYVVVNGESYTRSVVVSAETLREWEPRSVADVGSADIASLVAPGVEIVLIGSGATFQFPEPAALAPLQAARIGVEVMDTQAACRTYNILLAEGRRVVAALVL